NGDAAKNVLGPVPEVSVKLENDDMHAGVLMPPDTEGYVAKSMIDPFKPLIQEKKEIPVPEIEKPEKPQRILTPLEKMELGQIKLVAVVIMDDRKIAMVEEATGKGYEVDIGTYMGKNGGQVVDITFDTVVVKEMVTDYKGNQTERIREINMQKNDSGE
ncbi:MAG TPA: pilus assembly protein PilP, partial [Desulfotignum sp.]|nr:pilus assembly protein PilP [Desulfotignum sp.]